MIRTSLERGCEALLAEYFELCDTSGEGRVSTMVVMGSSFKQVLDRGVIRGHNSEY